MEEAMQKAGNFLERVDRRTNEPAQFDRGLVAVTAPASTAAEQYRVLFHRIERARHEQREMKVVVITSAVSGEGKSLTATNLALVAAAADPGRKILLVDADLRRPRISLLLGVEGRPGLGELLAGDATTQEVIRRAHASSLFVLPAGAPREDAGRLVAGAAMRRFLEQARASFDEVYVDSPPVLPVADGALLARVSDGVVLVVKAGVTSRGLVWQAVESLSGAKVLGCVLNGVETSEVPYLTHRL